MTKKTTITGDDLKALRKRRGFTQNQVADRIGVNRQTVGNWENGVGEPPSNTTFRLLKLFDVKNLLPLFDEIQSKIKAAPPEASPASGKPEDDDEESK